MKKLFLNYLSLPLNNLIGKIQKYFVDKRTLKNKIRTEKVLEQQRIEKLDSIKKAFFDRCGISVEDTVIIMDKVDRYLSKTSTADVSLSPEEHLQLLKDELRQNALKIANIEKNKISFFYEPEIINIHNEHLFEKSGPSIKALIADESNSVRDLLEQQYLTNKNKVNQLKTILESNKRNYFSDFD